LDLIQQLITPPFGHHGEQDKPLLQNLAPPTDVRLFKEAQKKAKMVNFPYME